MHIKTVPGLYPTWLASLVPSKIPYSSPINELSFQWILNILYNSKNLVVQLGQLSFKLMRYKAGIPSCIRTRRVWTAEQVCYPISEQEKCLARKNILDWRNRSKIILYPPKDGRRNRSSPYFLKDGWWNRSPLYSLKDRRRVRSSIFYSLTDRQWNRSSLLYLSKDRWRNQEEFRGPG